MEKVIRRFVMAIVITASAVVAADPHEEEARAHFTTATALYDKNELAAALAEFQRAYDLYPSYKIQFNLGQVAMELQDFARAYQAYTRYLREGGGEVPPSRVTTVKQELDRIGTRIGRVTVRAPDGVEVRIDSVRVGYTPLPEPVVVGVGHHEVSLRATKGELTNRSIDVAGQQTVTVAIDAAPTAAAVATRPEAPPSNTPRYVAWSLAGAFAVTAGVAGAIAISDSGKLSDLRATYPVTPSQLQQQRSSLVLASAIADGAGVAAVVTAGIALYLELSHRRTVKESSARLAVSPAGVFAVGTF